MRIARYVAVTLLAAVAVLVVGGTVAMWQQGYHVYAVRTGSMEPTYPTGSVVVTAPVDELPATGEVVTFVTSGGPVTHRVVGAVPDGLETKGDANKARDPWTVPQRNVVGEVVGGVRGVGYLLVFFQQPSGVPSLVLLALSVLFAWSLFFPADPAGTTDRRPRQRGPRPAVG